MTPFEQVMNRLNQIESKIDSILEAPPTRRTRKGPPSLSAEERIRIRSDYAEPFQGDLTAIDNAIDAALDHDAGKKAGNSGSWNLYVRNWLNTEVQRIRPKAVTRPQPADTEREREKWQRNAELIKERGLGRER